MKIGIIYQLPNGKISSQITTEQLLGEFKKRLRLNGCKVRYIIKK